MEKLDTLAGRLKHARKARGLSQVDLAKMLGTGQSTIASIESGRNHGSGYLIHIAEALQVNTGWLVTGKGERDIPAHVLEENERMIASGQAPRLEVKIGTLAEEADEETTGNGQIILWEKPDDLAHDPNRVWLPQYDLVYSAGNGSIQWALRTKRALPFTLDFFRAIGSNPENCRLAESRGNSMEPFLFDRDMIMIDESRTEIRDGKIYAICFEDELLVKQVFKQSGGALTLHSFNPLYPDRAVPPDGATHFRVVGQVVYRSGSGLTI